MEIGGIPLKNKVLRKYYTLDLTISIIGFIFVCTLYIYVKEMQQLFIILIAASFGMKIIFAMDKMEKKRKKIGLKKYSKRKIHMNSIKKLSH